MKMWSGRFREPLDAAFEAWQRSFGFDWQLLPQEIAASKAHAKTIAAAGVLTGRELTSLLGALDAIATDYWGDTPSLVPSGKLAAQLKTETEAEDIHHFVEMQLVARLGDLGQKLHTGRSRNEQIATDLRLYVRENGARIIGLLAAWVTALVEQARRNGEAMMPAYTHLQRAEPVLVAHWLLAYAEMLLRDITRVEDCLRRLDACPLGSGAVAGATLKLDRTITARELGFSAPTANSMDATSDRDFIVEYLQVLTTIGLHASRFAEEITLFATAEFGFVELPEAFSTGSSAMPQKKNPDLTELVRGKVGRLNGAAQTVTLLLKGLPLAYNKDMQETQEPLFAATMTALPMLELLGRFTSALTFRHDRMRAACEQGFLNAMAAATYLVHKEVPFRKAHEKIGNAVRYSLEKGCELGDLTPEELQQFGPEFADDFFAAVTLEATIDCHDVIGGTARQQVAQSLALVESRLGVILARQKETLPEMLHAGA
jgi:argininosuccinate lyase